MIPTTCKLSSLVERFGVELGGRDGVIDALSDGGFFADYDGDGQHVYDGPAEHHLARLVLKARTSGGGPSESADGTANAHLPPTDSLEFSD